MDVLLTAIDLVFTPYVLMVMLGAALFGLFVGSIPGLTATMATALLIPITFFMDPVPAIAAIVTTVAMAIFAGDIPGCLLRIPGTPASAAYADEAHALTAKGQAEKALGTSLVCAVIGGLLGTLVLATTAPLLAEFAIQFSSFEYFWLACLGLSCAVMISTGSVLKGAVSLLIGLFISTIGIDITAGHPRFTFGSVEMMGGISFIPAMIGMFAVSEVLRYVASSRQKPQVPQQSIGNVFRGLGAILGRYKLNLLRGGAIGTAIGVLPGAGADIAAWVAYAVSKRFSREPEKFGSGHVEGLVDSGSANNAGLSGAWVPALVFGIPGDSITAIVIGVLYMKGMNPGPTVFLNQPELIYAVFVAFFLANLALLPLGFLAIRLARQVLRMPQPILMPIILMFCIVGAFAINNTVFGISIMLVLGLLAYIMEENGFPIAPTILGIVLGTMLEDNFMSSMIKADGDLLGFFSRPIALFLGIMTLCIWFLPPVIRALRKRSQRFSQ
ncbi:tripartite tricarboxylate transporter permease [Denitrobaculum tricleocarpae]|uniref:Tripartite tricarboxylate transporter permease n=1 Tax=Denitrobaculum tricleocarpae TaxID=2591009 RepID=A0A545U2P7_9PROT|nr:tripartite tricarboxylate transporter permease [Denitrobaculum tricleocarpae]TQV83755.1 tripartite tricarboxylate transporter permease [Denitrobaculum tricleocarpae]